LPLVAAGARRQFILEFLVTALDCQGSRKIPSDEEKTLIERDLPANSSGTQVNNDPLNRILSPKRIWKEQKDRQ
jgi:hypothetical protein